DANLIAATALKEGTAIRIGLLDTASQALKIAKNQIDQVTKLNYGLSIENITLKKELDSATGQLHYKYKDKYLTLDEKGTDSLGNKLIDYTYDGDFTWVDYTKKKVPLIG